MLRRQFLLAPFALSPLGVRAASAFAQVDAGVPLVFPRDHGSHPAFRAEWWYITGWVTDDARHDFGVQVTFFRSRTGIAETSTSRFAPSQLLFAHAAIAEAANGRLRHDQRVARAGWGLAEASESDTDVRLGNWSLARDNDR
ncbi:MAG: lipocalin-like domain-containing protein, partial [Betaproteobacteria bacterium]